MPEEKTPLLEAMETLNLYQEAILAESRKQSQYLFVVYIAIVTICFLVILAFCFGLACGLM